jgi:hypothetical protein
MPAEPGAYNASDNGARSSFWELYRTWRYLFWLLGLVGAVLIFYAEENWRGYRAWEKYKQQMITEGEAFNAAAFIPPPVSDDENFAMTPALAPLFDFLPGTQQWRDPEAPQLFHQLTAQYDAAAVLAKPHSSNRQNSWVREKTDLALWASAFAQPASTKRRKREPLLATNFSSRDAAGRVLEALSGFDPVLDELRSAAARPYCRFNLRYEHDNPAAILLPHLAKIKYLCQVLQLRASAHLALGRTEQALEDLELMFYLTNTSHNEPILISQVVRMSEAQIALQPIAEGMGHWSEPQLRKLQGHLQGFDFCADIERSLRAERVLFGGGMIEYVQRSHNKLARLGEFGWTEVGSSANDLLPAGLLLVAAPSGWFCLEQLNNSRVFDQCLLPLIDLKKRQISPDTVAKAEATITKITEGTPVSRVLQHQFFSSLLLPASSKFSLKTAFAQSAADTAAVSCALERYRLAHGQFPGSLDNLVPDFIAALPHDLINGKPLAYRLEADGKYSLYSVGWNERDDGGLVEHNRSGEVDQKEGDWVWTNDF